MPLSFVLDFIMDESIARIGVGLPSEQRKQYTHHVSELGIITLPLGIYTDYEEEIRYHTTRYLQDISDMFKDLNKISSEIFKLGTVDMYNPEFQKHANGLWATQMSIMQHIHSTYALMGTATVPSVLLPKHLVSPNSHCYFIDPDREIAIPANLHQFNQDAYFYHIGGMGFKTYIMVDGKIEYI